MANESDHANQRAWLAKELDYLDADEDDRRLLTEIVELSRELLHGSDTPAMAYYRDIVVRLVQGKNVSPLTDDPEEWEQATPSLWKNKRNPDGFSSDGGRTHWFLSERVKNRNNVYTSQHYTPPPLPPEPDPIEEEVPTNADPDVQPEAVPGGSGPGDAGEPGGGGQVVPGPAGNGGAGRE